IARKKQNCIIKESFSPKFEKTRRNEIQRFIRNGGKIKCISQLSDKEISSSYISLFHSRFGGTLPCYEYDNLFACPDITPILQKAAKQPSSRAMTGFSANLPGNIPLYAFGFSHNNV
ncbi:TPA: hypothetical protein ACH9UE_004477, partial [Escherichia coli]